MPDQLLTMLTDAKGELVYFIEQDGQWLVDEVIEGITLPGGSPEATPATYRRAIKAKGDSVVPSRLLARDRRWELFEGDPASPHMCRGWFRCTADDFKAPKSTGLTLQLIRQDGAARRLDVEIVRVKTTEPEWEFVAER